MATAPAPTTAAPAPPTEDAAAAVPVPSASVPRGQVDLVDFIDWTGVECLNQDPAHGIANALKQVHREDEGLHLASHSNEQLLIHIPFVQAVNLHSALFKGPEEEGPKTVKLFSNREHIGSSNLSGFPPSDSVDLCSTHLLESKPMTLNHVKFQNVRSLTILIKDNQTGVNITQIQKIQLYGTTEIKEHHKTEDENRAKKMEVTESQKTARNNRCDVMAEKSALTAPTSGLGMLDNKNLATFTGPRNPLEVEAILTRILLRVPPNPSALLRASAVCKSWMSIVSAPQFFDKFVKFHKTPPLIGLLQDFRFLPILDPPDRGLHVYLPGDWKVKDCHHGLVLLQPKLCNLNFRVVDPMTHFESSIITVKVELPVCMAVAVVRDGGVSFRIVVLLNEDDTIYASIYSSASEQWSNSVAVLDTPCRYGGGFEPPTHVGNSLCWIYSNDDDEIVRYDLNRNILVIDAAPERADTHQWLVVSENNGLACLTGDNIEFWNKEAAEWKHCRSIPLSALLPQDLPPRDVHIRGADLEHGVMFLGTEWQQRILMVNLESMDIQQFVDYPQFSRYTFPYSNFHPAAALPHSYKKKGAPAKPKEVKKEDPKDDDPKPVVEAPNPLDLLPPSKMVLDEWKRLYKDSKSNFHEVAVKGLWDMYDPEGYSLWFCDYKYQEENTVSDVSLNKVTGFLEQMDPCRKYAFGKMLVIGSEAPFKLKGLWLFRGQEIPKFVMEEVKDMEMYEWTKVDISDEAHKERANAMIEDLEPFEGETLLDAKCFQ